MSDIHIGRRREREILKGGSYKKRERERDIEGRSYRKREREREGS